MKIATSKLSRRDTAAGDFVKDSKKHFYLGFISITLCLSCDSAKLASSRDSSEHRADRRGIVASGSMEPTLSGPRREIACPTCRRQLRIFDSGWREDANIICPRCGGRTHLGKQFLGNQEFHLRKLSRLEDIRMDSLVVFEREGKLEVKRVVGLPNQSVAIQDGEIWIDGDLHQKDWENFLRQAVLVHAERYESVSIDASRWREAAEAWRVYHHLNLWPIQSGTFGLHPTSIHDDFFMNPSESKILTPVDDIGCCISFPSKAENARLQFAMLYRGQIFRFEVQREASQGWFVWNGETKPARIRFGAISQPSYLAFAVFDDQVWIATNEESIPLQRNAHQSTNSINCDLPFELSPEAPMALRWISGKPIDTIVFRDNYWRPANHQTTQEFPEAEGYVLLGDHVAVSQDSRHHGRVPASWLRYQLKFSDSAVQNLRSQAKCYGE